MNHRYQLRKRRGGENEEQWHKHIRQAAVNDSVPMTTKITDVNNDCLERIFLFLSLEDLLNIAHTNKDLKPAADLAFARKFGGKKATSIANWHFSLRVDSKKVLGELIYLKNPFQLLRCFGHLIPKQMIYSRNKVLPYVNEYVNQYCSESTTEIEFFRMSNDDFNSLKKPFVRVETARFNRCRLNGNLNRLNILFPNIRYLILNHSETKPKHIDAHFAHLEELKIIGPIPTKQTKTTVNVLQMNSQLRRLTLDTDYTTTFIRAASQHLLMLEYLDITCWKKDLTDFGDEVVRFPCLKKLKVYYRDSSMPMIPIVSSCLDEFTCELQDDNVEKVIDFLEKHPSITKFELSNRKFNRLTLNGDTLKKIISALTLPTEIYFRGITISIEDADRVMQNFESVIKLHCNLVGIVEFEWLRL